MRPHLNCFIALLLAFGLLGPAVAQETTLTVKSPTEGATINGMTVQVDFNVQGITFVPSSVPLAEAGKRPDANRPGEGHLHLILDLQPVVVWERAEPYVFTSVPAGEHQLTVEVAQNDHSSLTPPVTQQIRFRTAVALPNTGQRPADPLFVLVAVALAGLAAGTIIRRAMLRRSPVQE